MKRFIGISFLFLGFAALITIVVWLYLQGVLHVPSSKNQTPVTTSSAPVSSNEESIGAEASADVSLPEPIPLRSLPLSAEQRSIAETFGIDVDTFIITPEMIICAETKLGKTRFDAIVSGDAPTFFEGTTLLACMR